MASIIPRYALNKAIDGGWHKHKGFQFDAAKWNAKETTVVLVGQTSTKRVTPEAIVLDLAFWEALERELDWSDWWDGAHKFFDLVLEKKSVDGFWEKMLKRQEAK
jgi:hypothetical protein